MPGTILKQLVTTPQTSGTTATTGNSGWSSIQAGTGNTHQHNDSAKMGQPAGYRLAQGGSNSNIAYLDLTTPVTKFAFRMPYKFESTPNASVQIGRWYTASDHVTVLGTMNHQSSNRVSFVETGATGILNVTSPVGSPLAPNTDYVFMGLLDVTANTVDIRCYARGSTSALFTLSGTIGGDMAAAASIGAQRFGIAMSGTAANTAIGFVDTNSAYAIGQDDFLARHDVSTTLASQTALSTSNAQVGVQISATVSHTGGNGNAVTYDVAWGDGTTSGPSSSGSFTHTYSTAGTYTVTGAAEQAN